MSENPDTYYNLAERIEEAFSEIDSDVCADLRDDEDYAELWSEAIKLQEGFPIIPKMTESGDGVVSLSAEEHGALVRYLGLKNDMENMERQKIYFRGHMDCFAYLKKIGAI